MEWIHYDEAADSVFCHTCTKVEGEGMLKSSSKDLAFLKKGYTNWKDATESFRRHEKSNCHQEAIQVMLNLFNAPNIGELVSDIHVQNKTLNRKLFLKILQNIKFLARQGIAFRGHDEAESNFTQLIKLRESDNPALSSWMKKELTSTFLQIYKMKY